MMKKLLLLLCSIFLLFSCHKNDEPSPTIDPTLLYGKKWKIISVIHRIKGKDTEKDLSACFVDNTYEFHHDHTYSLSFGSNKCELEEPDQETATFSISADSKLLVLNGTEFQLIGLTASSLKFQYDYGSLGLLVNYTYIPL